MPSKQILSSRQKPRRTVHKTGLSSHPRTRTPHFSRGCHYSMSARIRAGSRHLLKSLLERFGRSIYFRSVFFCTSRGEDYVVATFAEPMTQLKTSRLALENFKRFDETEDEEITRLSPHDLVCQKNHSFYSVSARKYASGVSDRLRWDITVGY